MTLEPITAVLESTLAEAELLEANGVNVVPLRRFAAKLESAIEVAQSSVQYITPREYGRQRGVSAETVRTWCAAGNVPGAIRVGTLWKIPK